MTGRARDCAAAVLLAGALGLAPPAAAGLFRCELPDGRVVYTDDSSKCPGSPPHEPSGSVQTVPSVPAPAAAGVVPPEPGAAALDEEVGEAAETHWRSLKRRKEEELRRVERGHEDLARFVAHCNRGGALFTQDTAGLKHGVSCDEVRSESEKLEARARELRAYLDDGIYQECRQSGCLPGWLR